MRNIQALAIPPALLGYLRQLIKGVKKIMKNKIKGRLNFENQPSRGFQLNFHEIGKRLICNELDIIEIKKGKKCFICGAKKCFHFE
tara:strand:+ start:770 stop:1027 length:258 start_codon:yes stop_codon:yes gene_type:complete